MFTDWCNTIGEHHADDCLEFERGRDSHGVKGNLTYDDDIRTLGCASVLKHPRNLTRCVGNINVLSWRF